VLGIAFVKARVQGRWVGVARQGDVRGREEEGKRGRGKEGKRERR
jgi:hypothetical protein